LQPLSSSPQCFHFLKTTFGLAAQGETNLKNELGSYNELSDTNSDFDIDLTEYKNKFKYFIAYE